MYVVSAPSYLRKDSLSFGSNSGNQVGHLGLAGGGILLIRLLVEVYCFCTLLNLVYLAISLLVTRARLP